MKSKRLKTTKCSILLLWLCLCCLGQAQTSGIWSMSNVLPDTSIIREWQGSYALVYTASANNGREVHLMEQGNTAVQSAQIKDYLRDIEILGDTAYYCGNDESGAPVVGFFSIQDLLSGGLNISKLYYPVVTNHHLKRLEVFGVQDGVHVIVVGDLIASSGSEYRILADIAYYYPTRTAKFYYYIASDQIEFFDDIAVTENYVVTAAHKHQSDGIYLRMFDKPTTADPNSSTPHNSIFYAPALPAVYDDIYYYTCDFDIIHNNIDLPVWIAATTGDSVAVACMSKNSATAEYGFTLKVMEVQPFASFWQVGDDIFAPLGLTLRSSWNVRDLRYSASTNKLLLLHDMDSPGTTQVESAVTLIDNASPSLMTGYFDNHDKWIRSIDEFPGTVYGYTASGILRTGSNLTWVLNDAKPSACFDSINHNTIKSTCTMNPFPMSITPSSGYLDIINYQMDTTANIITLLCY